MARAKLSRPKRATLALKGEQCTSLITDYVRVNVRLENGLWSAGETTLLVADLEDPYQVILGNPFLAHHRISIVPGKNPRLLVANHGPHRQPLDLFDEAHGPPTLAEHMDGLDNTGRLSLAEDLAHACAVRLQEQVKELGEEGKEMATRAAAILKEFDDLFPSTLPALTADYLARCTTRHRIRLADDSRVHNQRGFAIPRKWRESWKRMLEEHLAAGRLCPSSSPYASAAFVVPKRDPTADPRWVNGYLAINSNTIKDRTPLPLRDVVLSDAAREAFVDDIIIYSNSLEEHDRNCRSVLSALRSAGLYCSAKKTDLFTTRTEFLRHVISRAGLEADKSKIDKILNWPRPKTVTQVRGFLGVVQYLRKFIPSLAEHTAVLTPLTKKGLTGVEELWNAREEKAFTAIKRIVTSLPVLKPIDQDSDVPIWLMTDASKVGISGVLLQGDDWRTVLPCGFYSRQYIAAEKNYPTHEQELLAVVAALKAWRIDLLGVRFRILTDHDTLKHFKTQSTLSKRQARWTDRQTDRESIAASDKRRVRAYKRPMSAGQLARCPEGKGVEVKREKRNEKRARKQGRGTGTWMRRRA